MGVISDGGCVVTPKKRKLQEALGQIQEVCQSHGVHWRLEKIIGEEDGARIRIAHVKPRTKYSTSTN